MARSCFKYYMSVSIPLSMTFKVDNLKDLCMYFKTQCGGSLNDSELTDPSSSWEEWIFAESRRRHVPHLFPLVA